MPVRTTPPTYDETKALLLARVGAGTDTLIEPTVSDIATANFDLLWFLRADLDAIDPELQQLYVVRDMIDLIQGQMRARPDTTSDGESVKWQARLTALQTLRSDVQTEINLIYSLANTTQGVASGILPTIYPYQPGLNPSDTRFGGTPLRSRFGEFFQG